MEEAEFVEALRLLEANPAMVTKAAYRANSEKWPTNQASFVEVHTAYLKLHPTVNPRDYLANLRLMLRVRS